MPRIRVPGWLNSGKDICLLIYLMTRQKEPESSSEGLVYRGTNPVHQVLSYPHDQIPLEALPLNTITLETKDCCIKMLGKHQNSVYGTGAGGLDFTLSLWTATALLSQGLDAWGKAAQAIMEQVAELNLLQVHVRVGDYKPSLGNRNPISIPLGLTLNKLGKAL